MGFLEVGLLNLSFQLYLTRLYPRKYCGMPGQWYLVSSCVLFPGNLFHMILEHNMISRNAGYLTLELLLVPCQEFDAIKFC